MSTSDRPSRQHSKYNRGGFCCFGRALRLLSWGVLLGVLLGVGCAKKKVALPMKKASLNAVFKKDEARKEDSRESYDRIIENAYRVTTKTPISTFSIDVDTAAYSNVRRFLMREGRFPPHDAVRIEELLNYFTYDYPAPRGDAPVAFAVDIADCPWNARHHLVRIGLQSKKISPSRMPARNFVFLLDTSGSMTDHNKLPLLKRALRLLVRQLNDRDRVALVAYAGSAGLVLPSTAGSEQRTILEALNRLESGGSTNGGAGIELAYRIAQENHIAGGLNRVILGTDGDFNVGISNRKDLVRLIKKKRQAGVYLTVLGLGTGNLKDATMEELARHGNGHYAYIDSFQEAQRVFVEQGGALVTVAEDVKLQIVFNPLKVGAYRLIGYENRLLREEDFQDDRKDAGELGSGHTVTALYEIIPPGQPIPVRGRKSDEYTRTPAPAGATDKEDWLTVKLRYKDPGDATSKLLSKPLTGPVRKLSEVDADFRFATAVAQFGLLLLDSSYKGSASYANVEDLARSAKGADAGEHRAGFLEMVTKARKMTW